MKPRHISEEEFAAMTGRVSRDGVKKHTSPGAGGGGAVTERPAKGTTVKSGARTSHATNLERMITNRDRVRGGLTGRMKSGAVNQRSTVPTGVSAPSPFTLTLTGQIPSGKNQVQLLWRNGKVMKYPNKTFKRWKEHAFAQIIQHAEWGRRTIIATPVHLTCVYTPGDLRTRDVSGQLDALFHLLVYSKVLKDDGLIHDVTWRRHPMNRKAPQVVLTIEEVQP